MEIKPVSPKGKQPCIFIGRTAVEAEAPILWLCDAKSQLIGQDPGAGKDGSKSRRGAEDERVRWHHQLHGHDFKQPLGDSGGWRSLACWSPWGHQESGTI